MLHPRSMIGGLVGALAAAIPGLIDLVSLPAGPRGTAVLHMTTNLGIVARFAVNIWMRWHSDDAGASSNGTMWLCLVAIAMLLRAGSEASSCTSSALRSMATREANRGAERLRSIRRPDSTGDAARI